MPRKSKHRTTPSAYQKRKDERDQCKARLTTVEEVVRNQTEDLRQALAQLEACRAEVIHHDHRYATLQEQHALNQTELRQSQERIREHQAEQARLERLEADLRGQITAHLTSASERAAAMRELQELHDTIQIRLQEQSDNVEEERRQNMELTQERDTLRERFANLQQTHVDALAQHRAVQSQLTQTRSDLDECLASKQEEMDAFQALSENAREVAAELKRTQLARDETLDRFNNCQHHIEELRAQLAEKDAELNALHTEKQRLIDDIRRLQNERDTLEGDRNALQVERDGLVTATQSQARTLMMTTSQKDQLESQLGQCTAEKASLSSTLQSEQRALDQQRQQVNICSMERVEDQQRFQRDLQHKEVELTSRLATLNSEHERAMAQLQATLSERDQQLIESQFSDTTCKTGRDLDRQHYERVLGEQKIEMSTMAIDAEAKLNAKQNELSMASRDLAMCSSQKEEERTTHSRALQFRDMEHQRVVSEKEDEIRSLQGQLQEVQGRERGLADQLAQCEERFGQHRQLTTSELQGLRDEIQSIQAQQETCRAETARLTSELNSSKELERESQTQYLELEHQHRVLSNEHAQSVVQAEQRYQSALQDKSQSVSQAQEEKRTALAMARSNFEMDKQTLQSQFEAQRSQLEQELASVRMQMTQHEQLLHTKEEALKASTASNFILERQKQIDESRIRHSQGELDKLVQEKSTLASQHSSELSNLRTQLSQEQSSTSEQRRQVEQLQQQHIIDLQKLEQQLAAAQALQDQLTHYQQLNQTLQGDQERLTQQLTAKTAAFEAQVLRIEQSNRSLEEKDQAIIDAKRTFDQQLLSAKSTIEQNHQQVVAQLNLQFQQAQQQHEDGRRALEDQLRSVQLQFTAQKSEIDTCQAKIRQEQDSARTTSSLFQQAQERSSRTLADIQGQRDVLQDEVTQERMKTEQALQTVQRLTDQNQELQQQVQAMLKAKQVTAERARAIANGTDEEPSQSASVASSSSRGGKKKGGR